MFDYTHAAWRETVKEFKKILYAVNLALQAFYILYLVYALVFGAGLCFVNAPLLLLSVAYLFAFLAFTGFGKKPDGKPKTFGAAFKWSKRALKLVTIGFAVYEICTANPPDLLAVLFTAIMILGWVIQILLELLLKIVLAKFNFLKEGLEADVNEITRPFRQTKNFFKKITGQEVTPEKEPTQNQTYLKEKAAEYKAEQKQKKKARHAEWKEEQALARVEKKRERVEFKKSTRAERALLQAAKRKEKKTQRVPAPDISLLPPPNDNEINP